jgi:hypothetical protein
MKVTSYTSWPAKIRMDSDGTTLIVNADPATEAGIYERQSGTSWTLSQSILSLASYYSRNGLSISYDGNMVLVGDMTNDTDGTNFGRAFLWNKSGGSWSLTKTFSNPKTSPAVNDLWGSGVAIAKNTKDRIMIGMSADSTAGNEYGSVRVYTNAIPDFISFDGYKYNEPNVQNPRVTYGCRNDDDVRYRNGNEHIHRKCGYVYGGNERVERVCVR